MSTTPVDSAAWRLELFANRTGDTTCAATVSHDGHPLTGSLARDPEAAQQAAAVTAGIVDLAGAAARCFASGNVRQVVIELAGDKLLVLAPLDQGAHLVVLTAGPDREQLGFDLRLLVGQLNQLA